MPNLLGSSRASRVISDFQLVFNASETVDNHRQIVQEFQLADM